MLHQIGYVDNSFNARTCSVLTSLQSVQRPSRHDEATLDDAAIDRIHARNPVTAFGFACTQTPAFMPLPIWLAHQLARRLGDPATRQALPYLRPDGSTHVGIEYRDGQPSRLHSITLIASQSTAEAVTANDLATDLMDAVVEPVLREQGIALDDRTRYKVNPEGPFIEGGPAVHSGLTGRKNAIDTYGEYCRHSGSALSGKSPGRIDRVAAYAARYAAKNVVAAGLASECEVHLAYALGLARPVSVQVQTFGTAKVDDDEIAARVRRVFDFRPAAIVRDLGLRHMPEKNKGSFYRRLACFGHMGRADFGVPWEATDRVDALRS